MLVHCDTCARYFNDENCSQICPHKGVGGYCVVCDTFYCICDSNTTNVRSNNYKGTSNEEIS